MTFERYIANKLREAGFTARRVDESNGRHHGQDLLVGVLRPPVTNQVLNVEVSEALPVVLQCKATKANRDLQVGLREAVEGHNRGRAGCLFVCVHRLPRKPLRVLCVRSDSNGDLKDEPEEITWNQLLDRLKAMTPPW